MSRLIARWSLVTALFGSTVAVAQDKEIRMIIASDVACRVRPDTSASVMTRLQMGDVFRPSDATRGAAGNWFLDDTHVNLSQRGSNPGCWIFGPLSAPAADRHVALLAAADRILASDAATPFESFVGVDNLLRITTAESHGDGVIMSRSPLLQLRQLQVLARATRANGMQLGSVRDPLKQAWLLSYEKVIAYFEPGGEWFVRPEAFWALYERHRDTEWAEQIAWAAARADVPSDECDAQCILEGVSITYARYWAGFPKGRWVRDALAEGRKAVAYAAQTGCFAGGTDVRSLIGTIRTSLASVTEPQREAILAQLILVERKCSEQVPARPV